MYFRGPGSGLGVGEGGFESIGFLREVSLEG